MRSTLCDFCDYSSAGSLISSIQQLHTQGLVSPIIVTFEYPVNHKLHDPSCPDLSCALSTLSQFAYLRHKSQNSYPLTNTSNITHQIIAHAVIPPWTPQQTKPLHDCKRNDCDVASCTAQIAILIQLTGDSQIFK